MRALLSALALLPTLALLSALALLAALALLPTLALLPRLSLLTRLLALLLPALLAVLLAVRCLTVLLTLALTALLVVASLLTLSVLSVPSAFAAGAFLHAAAQRVDAAHEVARLVERVLGLRLVALAERRRGFGELAAQVHEIGADLGVVLGGGALGGVAAEQLPRVPQLLLHLVVAQAGRRLAQLLRGVLLVFRDLVRRAIELLLELSHLARQGVAALRVELHLLQAVGAGPGNLFRVGGDVGVFAREIFRLAHRVLHVALGPLRLGAAQLPLHLLQAIGRLRCLAGGRGVVAGGGAAHGIRCLLHLPGGVGEVLAVLFP